MLLKNVFLGRGTARFRCRNDGAYLLSTDMKLFLLTRNEVRQATADNPTLRGAVLTNPLPYARAVDNKQKEYEVRVIPTGDLLYKGDVRYTMALPNQYDGMVPWTSRADWAGARMYTVRVTGGYPRRSCLVSQKDWDEPMSALVYIYGDKGLYGLTPEEQPDEICREREI